jgi:hypothetical protein
VLSPELRRAGLGLTARSTSSARGQHWLLSVVSVFVARSRKVAAYAPLVTGGQFARLLL